MNKEEIIRNLEYTMEKHKNDTVGTFDTNISLMCKDILDYLEQEPCDDAISRELMFNRVNRRLTYTGEEIQRIVKNLPSTTTECVCLVKAKECEDAISRAWLKEAIHNLYHYSRHTPTEEDIQEYIVDDAPSVTPKTKMGYWIEHKHNGIAHLECSECSVWFLRAYLLRNSYCPNCGARMVESQESED